MTETVDHTLLSDADIVSRDVAGAASHHARYPNTEATRTSVHHYYRAYILFDGDHWIILVVARRNTRLSCFHVSCLRSFYTYWPNTMASMPKPSTTLFQEFILRIHKTRRFFWHSSFNPFLFCIVRPAWIFPIRVSFCVFTPLLCGFICLYESWTISRWCYATPLCNTIILMAFTGNLLASLWLIRNKNTSG